RRGRGGLVRGAVPVDGGWLAQRPRGDPGRPTGRALQVAREVLRRRGVPSDRQIGPLPVAWGGTFHLQEESICMFHILGSAALAYLAGSGGVTAAAVLGKGMVRAVRKAVAGNLHDAGVEAPAALAVPAVLGCTAMSALITEVVHGASELAGDALEGA